MKKALLLTLAALGLQSANAQISYPKGSISSSTAPSTTAVGIIKFDTNAWATARGAVQAYDGTANTWLVGALASDTPINGQYPMWNTGGTITWETPSGAGDALVANNLSQFASGGAINVASVGATTPGSGAFTTLSGNGAALTDLNATQLTSGTVPDARLPFTSVSGLLKYGIITAVISNVALTSNVVTITTDVAHGMIVGQKVLVDCSNNTVDKTSSADPAIVGSVPTTTTFTYPLTAGNIASVAATGTLTTWELTNDGGHIPLHNTQISAISATGVTVTWDSSPLPTKVHSASFGNHQNSSSGNFIPHWGAVGATTATIQLRQRQVASGIVRYNGGAADATLNASWTKLGDTSSVSMVASTLNVIFVGHSGVKLSQTGGTGAATWPPPIMQQCSIGGRPVGLNYAASPFTAAAYQPAETGFYAHLLNAAGAIMTPTDVAAFAAGEVQFHWERAVDEIIEHTIPFGGVTVFFNIQIGYP